MEKIVNFKEFDFFVDVVKSALIVKRKHDIV